MRILRQTVLAAALACLAIANDAGAVCTQTGANQADNSLFVLHGCWTDFFLWQYQAYDMKSSDWSNRGWNDCCNLNFEYTNHWNSSYLVTYGLKDLNTPFHTT